ncbi:MULTISPECIES: ABC transporter substrate-binding protein [unclassified Streptomyces]|uniref:ABC transporter substrate-binding protein n=1 Tax=Streptomyces sp. NBC_00119 TaxID=2975659 RepID=A0AAU1U504_9ACTN|nr:MULTISPECIES: ABC transporter substrate-binding protein [unclassified Streptomyces]MCX5435609.1 ABC transporter substrate-binding protein [Streptomyces sp. NBC_00063]WSE08858.1 ABC transporter substrate-binding protein [Streptomyces sp. NBC_01445]WSE13406.1 ABC transporter substrate-binding protein [Streptomyces sp. NBC_01397]WUB97677.1 ABC transporter substrate-binding protein [Streptomyces sp. NBC_00569]
MPPSVSVVAEELGFYADVGVDVETVLIESSTDQRDRLLSGNVDVGVTAMDNLVVWNAGGGGLRIVAQVESTTPLELVARPSVDGIEGLRGAVLGVDAVDNGFAVVLRHLLARRGLSTADYTLLPVGGVRERWEALRTESIDATLLGPPLDELAAEAGFVSLAAVEAEVPDYPGQGVVAGPAARKAGGDGLPRYLAALEAARQWLCDASDERVRELLSRGGHGPASVRAALRTRPKSLVPSRAGLERILAMRDGLGLLPQPAPGLSDLYDDELLGAELNR